MKVSDLSQTEFSAYFERYLAQVAGIDLLVALETGLASMQSFFKAIPEDKLEFRYAEGKWTPKDILLHLIDCERVFCYRALQFARAENVSLSGFDENEFADNSNANTRSRENLLDEYAAVRKASLLLFRSFNDETLLRTGKSSNNVLSVRAAGFIIAGHEKHHCQIITERYL
ncbi:DinB family protein [Ulvibacter sp. MAR_2010_11]|uniref:DinB family protein n=1 Tax=Ulvibacter sp. MAR_2010_11 TaxID=1250229 RepID=UPI000C2C7731|nr:DinB family protein [Ulvibacter sp. MAR_2010_11]PKA84088.1 DinB family protein [Ulvibacter sp. MAR_2010_11]